MPRNEVSAYSDRFARIRQLIGSAGADRLAASRVTVVGLGAVGGYAVEGLARAGIGTLRLVDFDTIQPSNINRQLYALESTLGRPKCEVAAARVREINPDCQVEPLSVFVHVDTMPAVLEGPTQLVIDAIDSLAPKVELLATLQARGVPVLSSMGAALRTDPTRIQVGHLADVRGCPLASIVRKRLRRRGVDLDIPCVYSTEPVQHWKSAGAIIDRDARRDGEPHLERRGRRRDALGSLPTLTGIFGLVLANEAIRLLLGGFRCAADAGSRSEVDGHGPPACDSATARSKPIAG